MRHLSVVFLLVLSGFFINGAPAWAQGKDITIDGQVKIGVHKFKLENTSLYQFEVKAKSFVPSVSLTGGFIQNTADYFKERNTFRGLFFPPKSQEYTVIVNPNVFGADIPEGLLDYTLTLKTLVLDETPLLKKEDKLTENDPKYQKSFRKTGFKAYPVKMKAGMTYIIDMMRKGDNNKIDPYLYLEDPKGQVVANDDDGGGFPNARIMYRAMADGEYQVIASGLSDQSNYGDYALMVRTVKAEK
jgi:hypothetical protein